MKASRILRTAFAAFAAAGLVAGAATAQQPQQQMQQPQTQPAPDFPEEKLDAFAEVATEVNKVIFDWRGRIQQAENEEERQSLTDEANRDIAEKTEVLISDTPDISMQEYQQIAQAAGQDPQLRQELQQRVREKMEAEQPQQ